MSLNARNPLAACCLLLGLFALSSTGCSIMQAHGSKADAPDSEAVPVATYRVKIIGKGRPKEQIGKLDRSKTVQTVLEETGTIDMFNQMDIVLGRKTDSPEANGGQGYFKLESDFDPESRQVVVSQDYAIHPGDVIVITKDTSNALDGLADKFSNAFGG